jgi:hypothetical protein
MSSPLKTNIAHLGMTFLMLPALGSEPGIFWFHLFSHSITLPLSHSGLPFFVAIFPIHRPHKPLALCQVQHDPCYISLVLGMSHIDIVFFSPEKSNSSAEFGPTMIFFSRRRCSTGHNYKQFKYICRIMYVEQGCQMVYIFAFQKYQFGNILEGHVM